MRSVMTHQFSQVPKANIPRAQFDRSHGLKTTFDAGYLVPIFIDEALPGDTFNLKATLFGRLATPEFPFMDNVFLETQFFAVPNRLLWTNWEKFNGEQTNPGDSTDYEIPTMTSTAVTGYTASSLHDYFGIPTEVPDLEHSSLWHRAYNLIYNEWYRDQNLQNSVVVDVDDGPDDPADYVLLRRGKRHDYFTSCLPWPQKGDAVELPLGTSAEVWGSASSLASAADLNNSPVISAFLNRITTDGSMTANLAMSMEASQSPNVNPSPAGSTSQNLMWKDGSATGSGNTEASVTRSDVVFVNKSLSQAFNANATAPFTADLSTATAATINQIREAVQIQKLYERDARGGTRYTEIVRSHFGVISPDARLQRPEYLGGGSSRINVHPVPQTSESGTTVQGKLAGYGTVTAQGHGFVKSFTEHCVLIGLVNVRADITYQQGLNRMFSRSTRWDFYWPALSHIGEQAVLNKEIYAQGSANPTEDAAAFGYQERYAEYRYKPSYVTGQFRSNFATSLDAWHLALDFGALPVLNASFIVDDPPLDRVIAVPTEPHLILDAYFSLKCARPMPLYGVPGQMDRF